MVELLPQHLAMGKTLFSLSYSELGLEHLAWSEFCLLWHPVARGTDGLFISGRGASPFYSRRDWRWIPLLLTHVQLLKECFPDMFLNHLSLWMCGRRIGPLCAFSVIAIIHGGSVNDHHLRLLFVSHRYILHHGGSFHSPFQRMLLCL